MADPFLSSDEYDEQAHQAYHEGRYDEAVELLREGLQLYPGTVELHVGMGYGQLAREEFAWSRRSFDDALAIDPSHEDALAGLGEVLLRLGERARAVGCFERVLELGFDEDLELVLQMGRALFREGVLDAARRFFEIAANVHPESPDAAALVGYASHRLGDEGRALTWLKRALALDPDHAEARIYLANLLYERGAYGEALAELGRTEPEEHWDELAIWRLIELEKSLRGRRDDDPALKPWLTRLADLAGDPDPTDLLLAELEAGGPDGTGSRDPSQLELFGTLLTELQDLRRRARGSAGGGGSVGGVGGGTETHRVTTPGGRDYAGSWEEIVLMMREDDSEWAGRTVTEFMVSAAARGAALTGVRIPSGDAESFIRGSAEAGLLRILG